MKAGFILLAFAAAWAVRLPAQNVYRYSVDLTRVANDELKITLITPKITRPEILFYMPKIVPGTYINSDFGKFVKNVKAYDKSGNPLPVIQQADTNAWKIKKANTLYRMEYDVEDTWDSKIKNTVYVMAGTNFEEGKNFSINPCGLFGYFDGMKKQPFELQFKRPAGFYASTALTPLSSANNTDVFRCSNADHLYDSPIMFCVPDTTTVKVGVTDVLVSVYSPKKLVTSKFVAENLKALLFAAKNYLGGRLPVNRYAFLYYFNGEQPGVQGQGAWEHSYSSFYCLGEAPQEPAISQIVDISSHEFFHIITPLNICSKEVREFNYNKTILSQHVWLYEGSTEYDAHHTQVTQGLITPAEYLKRLAQKILISRKAFNDTLSFTELSRGSAGVHKPQYPNVYMKGALISACLDIYLNKLSDGNYGLRNLKHDLSVRYGPENYFEDDALFDEITRLSFPELRNFFARYVEGTEAMPYETFFDMAGIRYIPKKETSTFTLGGFTAGLNTEKKLVVSAITGMNEFGKKMDYRKDDELVSLNGQPFTPETFGKMVTDFYASAKEGEQVTVQVNRKNASGVTETLTLTAPAMKVKKTEEHLLEMIGNPTTEQLQVRNAWLNIKCGK